MTSLITHQFPLAQTLEAMNLALHDPAAVKVVITNH